MSASPDERRAGDGPAAGASSTGHDRSPSPPISADPDAPASQRADPVAAPLTGKPSRGSTAPQAGAYARLVAAGIFLSRIFGLIREWAFAHYFGLTLYADAFRAALRIPNFIQNLLGEGTLSASFIPVYAELLHQRREEEAGRVAAATFALLAAMAGAISLLGIFFAQDLVGIVAGGFEGETLQLTIRSVRILFPMTGILVLYTWGLGILNSHRSFFLSYVAPVIWNITIIAACILFGGRLSIDRLVLAVSWAALLGGVLQFLVLLPRVLRLERRLSLRNHALRSRETREVVRNAGPAILGRGAVQISAWIDVMLASYLSQGAVSVISYTMTLFLLPVSLFGMSMAAAELPELARQRLDSDAMVPRVNSGLRQIAVMAMPSTVAYLVLGDIVIGAILQTGRFTASDTAFAWVVLAGFSLGLMASTGTRLFSSTFFALHDTRTPAWTGFMRVVLTAAVGWGLMIPLEHYFQVAGHPLGALGLTLGAGVAAWAEWAVLQRILRRRLGRVGAGLPVLARMFAAALLAALLGRAIAYFLPHLHFRGAMIVRAVLVLGPYGVVYFLLARAFGVEEARALVDRVLRRIKR